MANNRRDSYAIPQAAPDRARVLILLRHIRKILLSEAPVRLAIGCQRLRDIGGDARLVAGKYFFTLEITTVGDDGKAFNSDGTTGPGCVKNRCCVLPLVRSTEGPNSGEHVTPTSKAPEGVSCAR
ncbi:hypothetical protein D9M69_454320 [compost metagenome]